MKALSHFSIFLGSLTVVLLFTHCASMNEPYGGHSDLPVLLGSADGCRVSASEQPQGDARGKVRLSSTTVMENTHTDFYTGKSLTLVALLRNMSGAFGKAASAPAGAEVYKLGKLEAGGEARFQARGDGGIRIEYVGNSAGVFLFDRGETATLKRLIDQALAQ